MIKTKKMRETGGFQKASAISAIVQSRRLGVVQNEHPRLLEQLKEVGDLQPNEITNILATKFRGLDLIG